MIGLFPANFLFESKTKPVREQRLELLSDPQGRIRGLIFCKGDTAEQLIIRPPFAPSLFRKTAQLQTINPKRPIRHTLETSFLRELTAAICARPQQAIGGEDNYGFIQDRSVYFGLRAMAARIVNHSLNQVLAEASQPDLQTARRFSTVWRYSIYMATCLQGERLRQLADTFPLLLVELATSMPEAMIGQSSSKATALQMVLAGKPLKQIAEHMQTPYVLRLFKPGAIRRLSPELREFAQARPDILYSYLPKTTHQQRLWLAAVNRAIAKRDDLGDGFIEWTARYGTQLGQTLLETDAHLTNLSDFITASQYQNIACFLSPDSPRYLQTLIAEAVMDKARGSEFITRRFNSAMSLQTVQKLSAQWHEAVVKGMQESGDVIPFPTPWFDAGHIDGYTIVPITDSAELYREGHLMRHCVNTYQDRVAWGQCCIYSIQKNGARVATMELQHGSRGIVINQLSGPCNAIPPPEVQKAAARWLRAEKKRLGETGRFVIPSQQHDPWSDSEIPF